MRLVPAVMLGALMTLLAAVPAGAAMLVGGHEQQVIDRAFFAHGAHRGQVIVSTRASAVQRSWAMVRSVRPARAGGSGTTTKPIALSSAYYRSRHDRWGPGKPPAAVRDDLDQPMSVAVTYTGSGTESISYDQVYDSVCAGAGGFTDTQQDTVDPMSWSVRYVVDLDDLTSAVRGSDGVVLVPQVGFYRSRSSVKATEKLTRTAIDRGCNGRPTTFTCTTGYSPASPSQGLLSLPAGGGLEVGVPLRAKGTGDCNASDYTLGPSLWDSGATTALAPTLGLVGGTLPANPYSPVKVTWPGNAAGTTEGFLQSPCADDGAACRDTFRWSGTIILSAAG